MSEKPQKILWLRALFTGVAAVAIVFLIMYIVAFILALKEGGPLDSQIVWQFVKWLGMWLSPLLTIILAFLAGILVARKAGGLYLLHGILAGFVIVIFSFLESRILGGSLDMKEGIYLLFYWVSAALGGHRSAPKPLR